jgi:hypothetical protein
MSQSPGVRDRRPGGIADKRAGHRTDRSQHDRAGYRAEGRIPRALLGLCFERNKRAYDQRANQKILHGAFPAQYASAKDSENTATPRSCDSPRPVSRRGLNSCDDDNVPVICPTWQGSSGLLRAPTTQISACRQQFPAIAEAISNAGK